MDLIFDDTALPVLEAMGYKYFCTREEWMPNSGEDNYIYWELVPFTSQYDALDFYFECYQLQQRCHVFIDGDVIDELSRGIPGLVIRIKTAEEVFNC
ncbi:MAG: hypothetical protein JSS76_11730 [Bacteroidetes bacterium]|nr:hypothetical protein [Bacteroidota bacterium]